jgi:hypothetical protein
MSIRYNSLLSTFDFLFSPNTNPVYQIKSSTKWTTPVTTPSCVLHVEMLDDALVTSHLLQPWLSADLSSEQQDYVDFEKTLAAFPFGVSNEEMLDNAHVASHPLQPSLSTDISYELQDDTDLEKILADFDFPGMENGDLTASVPSLTSTDMLAILKPSNAASLLWESL